MSKGAVSLAFNNRPGIAAETRERILATARELGWTPNHRARALSVSRALAAGLVMARPPDTLRADPFFPSFIAGVESELSQHGYALLLQVVPEPGAEHQSYRRLSVEGRVDGVFLTDLYVDDTRPGLLAELGLPAVIVGPDVPGSRWPSVGVDDAPGVNAAVEHLVGLGHTRIAHVAGPSELVHGRSRREAWAATLTRTGLEPGPCVVSDFSAEAGATATRTLLELADPPTAIVYANDLMAIAGLSVAQEYGIAVPAQLSVTGFDNIDLAGYVTPPLTSVRTDPYLWGRTAADALLDLIAGEPVDDVEVPPAQLVVRASTAPPSPAIRTETS